MSECSLKGNLSYTHIEASIAASQSFSSYRLNLEGPVRISRTENVAPYAIFGDLSGNFFGKTLPAGSYTIEAIPFVGANATGDTGVPLKISFELTDAPSVIESFILVESTTGNPVGLIKEGAALEIDEDLTYAIIANANPTTQGSVVMELSGPLLNTSRTENQLPYTIFGDSNGTIFGNRFSRGDYTISGTPFSKGYGTGIKGEKSTVNFSISFYNKSVVIPNPIIGEIVDVYFGERIPTWDVISYSVYNMAGLKIAEGSFQNDPFFYFHSIDLSGKLTGRGVYTLQFGPDRIQFVY